MEIIARIMEIAKKKMMLMMMMTKKKVRNPEKRESAVESVEMISTQTTISTQSISRNLTTTQYSTTTTV